jgi:head-tail adaptor
MIQAGKLRHRFRIWNPTDATGAAGTVETMAPAGYVRGSLEEISASERYQSGLPLGSGVYQITCRFTSAITRRSELRLGGRTFAIVSAIDPEGLGRELRIAAEERI